MTKPSTSSPIDKQNHAPSDSNNPHRHRVRVSLSGEEIRHYVSTHTPTIRWMWGLHFGTGLLMVCFGIWNNGGNRKYIRVDTSNLPPQYDCHRAFVNVHALSLDDDPYTIVCCNESNSGGSWLFGSYESALCADKPVHLLFASTLTTMTTAWLLPLIPILLRILLLLYNKLTMGVITSPQFNTWATIRRLIVYILIMNIRGFVLYLLFNKLEHAMLPTSSENDTSSCFYQSYLRAYQYQMDSCYGRAFDFSDHVVLFMGHILPIFVFESGFCYLVPLWNTEELNSLFREPHRSPSFNNVISKGMRHICSIVAALMFVYINIITFRAVQQTAAYFHTGLEVMVGYVISLSIQIPLGVLLCTGRWNRMRRFVGLPPI